MSRQRLLSLLLPAHIVSTAALLAIMIAVPWSIKSMATLIVSGFGLSIGFLHIVAYYAKATTFPTSSEGWQHLLMAALAGPVAIAMGAYSYRLRELLFYVLVFASPAILAFTAGETLGKRLHAFSHRLSVITTVLLILGGAGYGALHTSFAESRQPWIRMLAVMVTSLLLGFSSGWETSSRCASQENLEGARDK